MTDLVEETAQVIYIRLKQLAPFQNYINRNKYRI